MLFVYIRQNNYYIIITLIRRHIKSFKQQIYKIKIEKNITFAYCY